MLHDVHHPPKGRVRGRSRLDLVTLEDVR